MKIVTFGEVLLRFSKSSHLRLSQGHVMNANFGGSEANVAVSLAMLGNTVRYVTRLPYNDIGEACNMTLRQYGLDTRSIVWGGERMGVYYFEDAASMRPSRVVYDRQGSAFATLHPGMIPWREIFADADVFACSGITCALSQSAADATMEAVEIADEMGLKIACDINYRKNLWNYGARAVDVIPQLMKHADVVFGDEGEWELISGLPRIPFQAESSDYPIDADRYKEMFQQIAKHYPRCKKYILGLRNQLSTNHHLLSGVLFNQERIFTSRIYDMTDVLDPMGVGDAYLAGFLHAFFHRAFNDQRCLDFALAASAMKNAVVGDFNLVSEKEIDELLC